MKPIRLDGIAWFDDGPFMESTMARTWELEPTSTRIIGDFKSLPRALDVITAKKIIFYYASLRRNNNVKYLRQGFDVFYDTSKGWLQHQRTAHH